MSRRAPANNARLNFRLPTIKQENFTRLSNRDRDVFTSLLDDKGARPNRSLTAAAGTYKNRPE